MHPHPPSNPSLSTSFAMAENDVSPAPPSNGTGRRTRQHRKENPAGEPDVVVAEGMDITPLHEGTSFIRYYGGPIKGYYYVHVRDVGSSTIRGPLLMTPIKEGVPPAGFPVTRGSSSSSAVAEDAFPSPRGGSSSSPVAEEASTGTRCGNYS